MNAGQLGYWFGGFVVAMLLGYILLRIAGAKSNRKWATVLGIVIPCVLFVIGGFNPGALLAVIICVIWAVRQANKPAAP